MHRLALLVLVLALVTACSGGAPASSDVPTGDASAPDAAAMDAHSADVSSSDAPGVDLPPPRLWPAPTALPTLTGPFHEAHPELAPWSRWVWHHDQSAGPPPNHRGRAALGTGNGHVFGFTGLAAPANTVHSLVGPTYEKAEGFFGDIGLGLVDPDGAAWSAFDEEWVARSLGAPALFWRGRRGTVELDVVDLVPWGAGDGPVGRAWLRTILVRNVGEAPATGLRLEVHATRSGPGSDGATLTESRGTRRLVTAFDRTGATATGATLALPLPTIAVGAEERVLLVHAVLAEGDDEATALAAVRTADVDALLRASAESLGAWWGGLVRIATPDPLVDDLYRGLLLTLKVQTAASGATCPMSEYTGTWTRDNVGPVRALLAAGGHDDVSAMLDYYWRAVLRSGDVANRFPADLALDGPSPEAPDWDALPPFSGRTAAEGPSWIPLMYAWHAAWTGDETRVAERLGLLRRCVLAQPVSEGGFLSWSGDETFRAAMNATFGLALEYPHQDETWSTNSSLLFVAAARALARLAEAAGDPGLATSARAKADGAEAAARAALQTEDGCWAAFAWRSDARVSPPFEDVALQEIWAGARDATDDEAEDRLHALVERLGVAPGLLQSPLATMYQGNPVFLNLVEGIYTGMLPGYTLSVLAAAGHPEAEAAFENLRLSADPGGNYSEYVAFDDHRPLHILYDPSGELGDYTARFRPWEGGIVLAAFLEYLVGVVPQPGVDAFTIRPHLPSDWPALAVEDIRVRDARFDVTVRRIAADAVEVAIRSRADRPFAVFVQWDHERAIHPSLRVDGVPSDSVLRQSRWTASTSAEDLLLDPGEERIVRIEALAPAP